MSNAYAEAGVDQKVAAAATDGLVGVLRSIKTDQPSRSVLDSGHYANVLAIAPGLGLAVATDGVGSKVVVAEQMGRFDTIGIDCIAMNVNDIICVGAEPVALVDYIAVQHADSEMLASIAVGLKRGAEKANIEIPGGEVAQLPELIRGHPDPFGFDLSGACFGTVNLEEIITGADVEVGDAIIGIPSSGVHANGLTLARHALLSNGRLSLDDRPEVLCGDSIGDALLEPTEIYVRAVMQLLRSNLGVRGLAHITSDGICNLGRLGSHVGYDIEAPFDPAPVFSLIQESGDVSDAEMYWVFNMGCGFCCVVPPGSADDACELLGQAHPGTRVIGTVSDDGGWIKLPSLGLIGNRDGLWPVGKVPARYGRNA